MVDTFKTMYTLFFIYGILVFRISFACFCEFNCIMLTCVLTGMTSGAKLIFRNLTLKLKLNFDSLCSSCDWCTENGNVGILQVSHQNNSLFSSALLPHIEHSLFSTLILQFLQKYETTILTGFLIQRFHFALAHYNDTKLNVP